MGIMAWILVTVIATSALSGLLGMAGGMVLMAVLVSTLSVAAAMMVHGAVQATANGSRAWFLREHIQWQIIPPYLVGAGLALAAFASIALVPNAGWILVLVGSFPWLARLLPYLQGLDITRPATAVACGSLVTAAQLFAGASGPLLDVFYLNSPLNRYGIVASKAVTQALGHVLKLIYYGLIIGVSESIEIHYYLIAMLLAVVGTRVGTRLLDHVDDAWLKRVSGYVILTIATLCLVKGITLLLGY